MEKMKDKFLDINDLLKDPLEKKEKNIDDKIKNAKVKEKIEKIFQEKNNELSVFKEENEEYIELLNKKNAAKELEILVDEIVKKEIPEKFTFKQKLKNIFSKKSKDIVIGFSGGMGTLFLCAVAFMLISLLLKAGFLWALISLFSVFILSLLSVSFLHQHLEKEIIESKKENILNQYEISKDELIKSMLYFDEEDKEKIKYINAKNGSVKLKDILNLANKKRAWLSIHEKSIEQKMKVKNNEDILNNN